MVSSPAQNVAMLVAWSAHQNEILLATFNSTLSSVNFSLKRAAFIFDDLAVSDFNNDGSPDLLLFNRQERVLASVLDLMKDTLIIASKMKIPFEPDQLLFNDYNNDGRMDIFLYAQNTPGILPLSGNGRGHFVQGKIIAEDNAIGAADFAYVNNDNLIDIIIWDWVKSELHVLYGVGKGRFIDQSVFPVQGEVDFLKTASLFRKQSLDLILKMKEPSGFQVWEGNEFGDFQLKSRIASNARIIDFAASDINNDKWNDILFISGSPSLQIALNNNGEDFLENVEYACGSDPQRIFIAPSQSGYPKDCIVFDRGAGQFVVFKNSELQSEFSDSILLSTGVFPEEIITGDFNKDGNPDLALVNVRSQSLSLYYGNKHTAPSGPVFYSLTEKPKHLVYHSSTDTSLQFVLSFPQAHQISYLVIDSANNSVSNAFIDNEGDVQIIDVSMNKNLQAEFATWNRNSAEGNSLSFYEQLGATTFIERSFHLSPPDDLLGATVADLNNDGIQDIVYVYHAGGSSKTGLGIAFGDSAYSMKQRFILREMPITTSKHVYLWLSDFDRDKNPDMLIQTGYPDGNLFIAAGKGEGYFNDPQLIADSISITDRSEIQLVDADNDGLPDVVFSDQRQGCVFWLHNENECNFSKKEKLFAGKGLSHFIITDINSDGVYDLAITFSKKGFLKIVNGKRLPSQYDMGAMIFRNKTE